MTSREDHLNTRTRCDALGTVHGRAETDARIVSLVPSITELVCDLGLSDRLVGRTGFCIHPWETVRTVPKVGGTKDVKLERVRELQPTHVIVNVDENLRETAEQLAEFVPHVIVTHPQAPEDNLSLYRLLGAIFGREAEAERLCAEFSAALSELQSVEHVPLDVLYLIWRDPWMAVAPDTYIAQTLALINWRSHPPVSAERYPQVDLRAYTGKIDRVLLSTEPFHFKEHHIPEVQALISGAEVTLIDGEMVSWYGSRAIQGLRYLANIARATDDVVVSEGATLPIESPCIGVCAIDETGSYCQGCMRTLSEIANWTQYTSSERRRIMSILAERRQSTT